MRHLLWLSILLTLPGIGNADPLAPPDRQSVFTDAAADPGADGERVLDLTFEPALSPPSHPIKPAHSRSAGAEATPEAPVTFGLVITTRREVGDEAKAGGEGLTDEVTGLVKRSTFGLSGTYHF